jgi:hypothetical protein
MAVLAYLSRYTLALDHNGVELLADQDIVRIA